MAVFTYMPKQSSHVKQAVYDDSEKTLSVTFHNGKVYSYGDVPQEAYDNMVKYRSAGEFFQGVIRRNYKGVEVK